MKGIKRSGTWEVVFDEVTEKGYSVMVIITDSPFEVDFLVNLFICDPGGDVIVDDVFGNENGDPVALPQQEARELALEVSQKLMNDMPRVITEIERQIMMSRISVVPGDSKSYLN